MSFFIFGRAPFGVIFRREIKRKIAQPFEEFDPIGQYYSQDLFLCFQIRI